MTDQTPAKQGEDTRVSEVRCGEVFRETATGVGLRVIRVGGLSVTLAPVRAVKPTVLVSLERLASEFERLPGIVA